MSNNVQLTKEEILATIKHSSIPTVLVEGKNDIIFYRRIEEDEFNGLGLSMLPAGNKDSVISIKNEVDLWEGNKLIAYIVDRDTWINFGVPSDIENVIFTKGYSIENDLIEDGNLCSLLYKDELKIFNKERETFIKWYALTLARNREGRKQKDGEKDFCYQEHPNKVLDDNNFLEEQMKLYEDEQFPINLFNDINENWYMKLRGKSLLALLVRQLSRKERRVKYSKLVLMDLATSKKGKNYMRIVSELKERFKV